MDRCLTDDRFIINSHGLHRALTRIVKITIYSLPFDLRAAAVRGNPEENRCPRPVRHVDLR